MLCKKLVSDKIIKFLLMKNYELMISNLSRKNNKDRKILMKRLKWKNSLYFIILDYLLYKNTTWSKSILNIKCNSLKQDLNYMVTFLLWYIIM